LRYEVVLMVEGAHVVQPSPEVRKLDMVLAPYKKRVIRDGGRIETVYSPIPPESFKGALRHVSYIVALRQGRLATWQSLFGSDVPRKTALFRGEPGASAEDSGAEATPDTKPGKISVWLKEGLTPEELRGLVEVRQRIRIDRSHGSVLKEALVQSEALSVRFTLTFEVGVEGPVAEDEKELLEASFRALEGWGIGGWASAGFGFVREVRFRVV